MLNYHYLQILMCYQSFTSYYEKKEQLLGMLLCVAIIAYFAMAFLHAFEIKDPAPFIFALLMPCGAALGIGIGVHAFRTLRQKGECKWLVLPIGVIFFIGGLTAIYIALVAIGLIPGL